MKIFLSYSSDDKNIAEQVNLALLADGHDVFFDRSDLEASKEYNNRIKKISNECDFLVFLISPSSIKRTSYTLTELKYFKDKWRHPKNKVLPVVVRETDLNTVPNYLKAVTILEPQGNIAAEVAESIKKPKPPVIFYIAVIFAVAVTLIVIQLQKNKDSNTNAPIPELKVIDLSHTNATAISPCEKQTIYSANINFDNEVIKFRKTVFTLGENSDDLLASKVEVDEFYLDKFKVTNYQYKKFINETKYKAPETWTNGSYQSGAAYNPVSGVTWFDAKKYCNWQNKRLPTEAEWELACIGDKRTLYPWGNLEDQNLSNTNGFCDDKKVPVGTFSIDNPMQINGVIGIFGNVMEWTNSKFKQYPYQKNDGREDSNDPEIPRVTRGRSFKKHDHQISTTCRTRSLTPPFAQSEEIGFRCAKDP